MPKTETLNEISHLVRSRFGHPKPRHGLKLLFWFANDCLSFDHNNDMIADCDPENREFGFHPFENRYDRNGTKLLPDVDFQYYMVGNLNSARAYELPYYVREDYTGRLDNSNMDRIIVSLDSEWFDRVYVTEHDDRTNFNPDATYRISKGLLKLIRNLELDDFLRQTGYGGHIILQFPKIVSGFRDSPTHDLKPVSMMACAVTDTPKVSPPKNQDCLVEIESNTDYIRHSNDRSITRYSSSTSMRKRCCECTIL